MTLGPSLVTPSGRLRSRIAENFPRQIYRGYRTGRTHRDTSRVQRRQKLLPIGDEVDVDLHTQQVTFLPMSTEGLSIPPALLFTNDQTQEIMILVTATESKSRK